MSPRTKAGLNNCVKASVTRSVRKQVMCLKKKIETLQLKLKRGKGIKAKRVQKATGGIKVAFEKMTYSSAAVGRMHNIFRDSVRRWPMKYSIAWNNGQDQMLRHAASSVQQAVQGGRRLMVVVDKSKWDEAKHTSVWPSMNHRRVHSA